MWLNLVFIGSLYGAWISVERPRKEFGSYPEEHGQGKDKGGGRETNEEGTRWSGPSEQ